MELHLVLAEIYLALSLWNGRITRDGLQVEKQTERGVSKVTTLTAHQPNFLPWLPFFDKARASDVFVILQNAQYVKGNFHNRFALEDKWYTMSTKPGLTPLCSKKYINADSDWLRIKRRLPAYERELSYFDDAIGPDLVSTNLSIILKAMKLLGGSWPTVELEPNTGLSASERIVELCILYGANHYLSGPSGTKYLDTQLFEARGIKLTFFHDSKNKSPILKALQ